MVRLIVNADDLGAGSPTDFGIFEAFTKGCVTCASVLPNGPSFTEAVREANRLALPLGAHLNLSEGRSLTGPIEGLTDAGDLPGKWGLRKRLMADALRSEDLIREFAAQVERLLGAGCMVNHLDTHQHAFLFPAVTTAVLATAHAYGIPAVRLPAPAEDSEEDPPGLLGAELALYRRLAPAARRAVSEAGLLAPDGLWGMPWLNRLDESTLEQILSRLPEGDWELMVHPGYQDPNSPFAGPERERELGALTSPFIGQRIRQRGIRLISFGELLCAS